MLDPPSSDAADKDPLRPCSGVIEVPVDTIDDAPAVGVTLQVRSKGDGFIVLVIGEKRVRVQSYQLEAALQSLWLLERAHRMSSFYGEPHRPLMPPRGPIRPI